MANDKKMFKLYVNDKFLQYLLPSDIRLLKWDEKKTYRLEPVMVSPSLYNKIMGK